MDDDVVIEGSALHEHLKSFDLNDFEVMGLPQSPKCLLESASENSQTTKCNEITYFNSFVDIILKSHMLLKEDCEVLEFSFEQRTPISRQRFDPFKNIFIFACGALAVTFYQYIEVCVTASLPVAANIFMNCYSKYIKYTAKQNLEKHLTAISELYSNVTKILKLVKDFCILMAPYKLQSQNLLNKFTGDFNEEFLTVLNEITQFQSSISRQYIDQMGENIPTVFHSILEFELVESDLQKTHHKYLLSLSEYMRTLGLCYACVHWKSKLPSFIPVLNYKILPQNTKVFIEYSSRITLMYDRFRRADISTRPNKCEKFAVKKGHLHDAYIYSYQGAIHTHKALNIMWTIVQCLEKYETVNKDKLESVLNELSLVHKEFDNIKSCVSLTEIRLKRLMDSEKSVEMKTVHTKDVLNIDKLPNTIPTIEDRIEEHDDDLFECFIPSSETIPTSNPLEIDVPDNINPTGIMFSELRGVLTHKRLEWEKREAKVRERKGLLIVEGTENTSSTISARRRSLREDGDDVKHVNIDDNRRNSSGSFDSDECSDDLVQRKRKRVVKRRPKASSYSGRTYERNRPTNEMSNIMKNILTAPRPMFSPKPTSTFEGLTDDE